MAFLHKLKAATADSSNVIMAFEEEGIACTVCGIGSLHIFLKASRSLFCRNPTTMGLLWPIGAKILIFKATSIFAIKVAIRVAFSHEKGQIGLPKSFLGRHFQEGKKGWHCLTHFWLLTSCLCSTSMLSTKGTTLIKRHNLIHTSKK